MKEKDFIRTFADIDTHYIEEARHAPPRKKHHILRKILWALFTFFLIVSVIWLLTVLIPEETYPLPDHIYINPTP